MAAPRCVLVVVGVVLATVVSGPPFGRASPPRRIVVTANGRIGPLRIDKSDRAEVIAFAGQPESEVRSRYESYTPFDALGYGCAGKPATGKGGFPRCQTVFYLDAADGKLMLLWTVDARYTDLYGIHVGTPTSVAEQRLHRIVYVGCLAQLQIVTQTAFLAMLFQGGKIRVMHLPYYLHLVGGHVGEIVVRSNRVGPGVLDCIG